MTQKSLHGQYAGFISRLSAFIIDLVIVTIIIIVSTWIVSTILNFFGLSRLFMLPDAEGSLEVTTIQPIALMLAGMSTSAFAIGYFLFSWVLTGQTPGKVIVGLRIVCLDGQPMTFARSIRRMIGYWLAALPFFLGFMWTLLDDRRQGWHDKFAHTCVIYTWDAHLDEHFLVKALERFDQTRESSPGQLPGETKDK
ncbi:MAG: RDD family protein [Anaerolineales bacterium]|nr:RDD family protein [Anaerolineales bacterium]MCA9963773.1 RDD family protein [Anaerolineales bacterium]